LGEKLIGSRIIEQSFLRENANLEVYRPQVIFLELENCIEAPQSDERIDLDVSPHARRALNNGLLQNALAARVDILLRKFALELGNFRDRMRKRLRMSAAVEDASFVQMNMRFYEAAENEASLNIDLTGIGLDFRRDLDDVPATNSNVELRALVVAR